MASPQFSPDDAPDRNLLFGILALQNNFISREALLAAFTAWVVDKQRPLGEILCEQGKLTQLQDELLRALTQQHVIQHGNDPQQSLAAVSSVGSIRDELHKLGDPQLEASLAAVAQQHPPADPYATNIAATRDWGGTGQRFRVLRPHAKGGLGEVFVAHDQELHREVALKEIQSRFADQPDSRSRFVLEAEITGGLEHPGIVPVYGLGQYADGRPFYAMRFIRGDSLKDAIERFHKADVAGRDPGERTLELRKLLGRFIDVCEAIEYAHSRGVLHRDLKPGNIMLGKYGETLVVDWGLAKSVGRSEQSSETGETSLQPSSGDSVEPTLMGKAIGTPAYMSPEQAAGRLNELGPASDVYSLGATLYCLLTGQPPFSGTDHGAILRQVQQGKFPRPREVRPHVPVALQAICLKAMALKPADRFASPKMLADDLEHWQADEPVSCLAEPLVVRARRWMKRHRTLVASSTAGAAVLMTSLVVLLALVAGHNRTLDATNRQLDDANSKLTQANTDLKQANASERAAKEDADQKRSDAERARDETKQAFDFLVAAFRKSDPSQDGETLTVAALFGQAADELEATFPKQPLMQAQLLNAIGQTYHGLGLYQKAVVVLERAKDLHRKELGADHKDTLTSMNNLAYAYKSAGRLAEALPLFEQTLDVRKANFGLEHPDTLMSMNNLAYAYFSVGRIEEALPLFEESLKLIKVKFGPEHPNTLMSMDNLATSYASVGRMSEALPLYQVALEVMKAKLGPEHPDTLVLMNNLADAYETAGRLAEAVPLFEQTLKLKKAKLGPDHPSTLISMSNLAHAYKSAGRLVDALPLYEQTIELKKARLGPEHPSTLTSMGNLASAYLEGDQPAKALQLFAQLIAGHRGRTTPDDPAFADGLAKVSLGLLQHRQYPAAETYLRECLTIRERKLPDDWALFNTKSMLGGALAGQMKFQEAEPLLVEGYQGMKDREAKIPPAAKIRLPEAIQRLVDLYTAWDKPEKAAEWKGKLEEEKPPSTGDAKTEEGKSK